ncbi:MAG: group 1 truncated hemoglobin [Deltaproteobacteria bacterium]|nr:group 1 truncated hemoglobin [Deltaproteobacteria bacterium]
MKEVLFGRKITSDSLRTVVAEFYRRVFDDVMIGFMFSGKDRARLIQKEWELAAAMLGSPDVKYTGRPMRAAHAQHTIFGGQFERRLQILKDTMRDLAVDPDVQRVWIDHTLSLRAQITGDVGSECKDTGEADKLRLAREPAPPDKPIKLGRR